MNINLKDFLPSLEEMTTATTIYFFVSIATALAFIFIYLFSPDIYKETMKQLPKVNHVEDLIIIDYNAELDLYNTCRAIRKYLDEQHENNHFVQYEIFPRHCLNVKP